MSVRPLTAAAGVGLVCAVGAAALWGVLVTRGSLEALGEINSLWFVAFLFAWMAGLGLSVAPQRNRRQLSRTCAGLSIAGLTVVGLTVVVSPWTFLFIVLNAIDAIFT